MLAVTVAMFLRVPGGLLPDEDQGYNMLVTMLPPAASLERSSAVAQTVVEGVREESGGGERVLDGWLRRAVVRAEDLIRRRLRHAEGLVATHRSHPGRAVHRARLRRAERDLP